MYMGVHYRWLKTFNISLASERQQRKLATAEGGTNLVCEMVPFTFHDEGDGENFCKAPFAFVPNLRGRLSDRLTVHLGYDQLSSL